MNSFLLAYTSFVIGMFVMLFVFVFTRFMYAQKLLKKVNKYANRLSPEELYKFNKEVFGDE